MLILFNYIIRYVQDVFAKTFGRIILTYSPYPPATEATLVTFSNFFRNQETYFYKEKKKM